MSESDFNPSAAIHNINRGVGHRYRYRRMSMAMDSQATEGTGSSMNGPHFHNIISQATRTTSAERRPSAAPTYRRLWSEARQTDGGRLAEGSSAAYRRPDSQTLSDADHAASATGSAITDAVCRADRSAIGFFEKFRKNLSLILIEAEPLGGFCP